MQKSRPLFLRSSFLIHRSSFLLLAVVGCGSPNRPNIALRKQNQTLQGDVARLNLQHQADVASIDAVQKTSPGTTRLPATQLDRLFTTHGLSLGMLTAGNNPSPTADVDSQLLVYAVPTDNDGEPLKAAGSFEVQAYDLAEPSHPLVGQWSFSTADARSKFYAHLSLYTYVLPCEFKKPPKHDKLNVRVTFHDELTGRTFSAERQATVRVSH